MADNYLNSQGVVKVKDYAKQQGENALDAAKNYTDTKIDELISEETIQAFEALGWMPPSGGDSGI